MKTLSRINKIAIAALAGLASLVGINGCCGFNTESDTSESRWASRYGDPDGSGYKSSYIHYGKGYSSRYRSTGFGSGYRGGFNSGNQQGFGYRSSYSQSNRRGFNQLTPDTATSPEVKEKPKTKFSKN